MSKEVKEHRVLFRMSPTMLKQLDEVSGRLKLKRPEAIRLGIDTLIGKYRPGHEGEITILETKFLNTILTNLGSRIRELENPKGQIGDRVREAAEAAKKVRELRRQGKGKQADKLLREREKKGKYTSPGFSWVDDKQ